MQTETTNNSVVIEPLGSKYKLRFDDDVIHPSYYRFELEALSQAQSSDQVVITVNTDGGSAATGIEVANAIFNCQAPVEGILRSSCHSCGSIIFLACNTHDVGLASEMLLHSGNGFAGGTPTQAIERAKSYKRQVRALFQTVYKGFLSSKELDQMIDEDKEFIFSGEEIVPRLESMYKYREDQQEGFYQEQEDALWEANSMMVDEALDTLDVSEVDKEIFNRVRVLLDNSMMEGATSEEALAEDTAIMEDILQVESVYDMENVEVGEIVYYRKDGEVSNVVYHTLLDSYKEYWCCEFPMEDIGETKDSREDILVILRQLTGKKYTNYSTKNLITHFKTLIYELIE